MRWPWRQARCGALSGLRGAARRAPPPRTLNWTMVQEVQMYQSFFLLYNVRPMFQNVADLQASLSVGTLRRCYDDWCTRGIEKDKFQDG